MTLAAVQRGRQAPTELLARAGEALDEPERLIRQVNRTHSTAAIPSPAHLRAGCFWCRTWAD